jgi:predicted PurR-regulated permease PerM
MTAIYFNPRTKQIVTWILLGLALLFLYAVRSILTPFIAALITAYMLNPVVNWTVRRTGLPRPFWVLAIYFALLGGLFWGLSQVIPVLADQVTDLGAALPGYLAQVQEWLKSNRISIAGVNVTLDQLGAEAATYLTTLAEDLGRGAPEIALSLFTGLLELIIYVVCTFFFLMNAEKIIATLRAQAPPDMLSELDPWLRRIAVTLGAYVRGQAILVLYMMTATSISLALMDVRHALALGVMTGLVELIPFAGPYLAGGITVLVAMTQGGNAWGWSPIILGIAVVIVFTILRQAQDNVIGPLVLGKVIDMHPVAVIFFVLAGAALAGLGGLLLAVPVAAVVRIILEFVFQKLREEGPRAIVPVSATATWEDIARELRHVSTERAMLVAPAAPPALHDPATYRLMTVVAHEAEIRLALMTDDETSLALARQFGIETIPLPTDLHPAAIVTAGHPGLNGMAPVREDPAMTPAPVQR